MLKKLLHYFFPPRPKVENDYFGVLRYDSGFFEGQKHFQPQNCAIGLVLYGDIAGTALTGQKMFFQEIEVRYDEMIKTMIPVIEEELQNWKPEFTIVDFKNEFTPDYIMLPANITTHVTWEIGFTSFHDPNHWFCITMHDFAAKEILVDG